jgi:alpha-ketoglutarate-dependent taurine dioxygenase
MVEVLIDQCWKNPVTGSLHFQVHPCGAKELHIDPLSAGSSSEGALYPEGGVVTDLKVVRETLYAMQRPGISPQFVYAQDWKEGDLVLFHNRGLLHSVTGAFTPDQLRMFHQVSFLIDGGRELMIV